MKVFTNEIIQPYIGVEYNLPTDLTRDMTRTLTRGDELSITVSSITTTTTTTTATSLNNNSNLVIYDNIELICVR